MSDAADTGLRPAGVAAAAEPARSFFFVRRVTPMHDFELVFVSSVATILLVRGILAAGRPRLGGGKIHFAGLFWLLLQLAVIRSMVAAELASSAIRLQDASSGGAHGTHQV